MKHALTNPPVVAFPDFTVPFSLYTDASGSAIGAVLAQRQGNQEKWLLMLVMFSQNQKENGQHMTENFGPLSGPCDTYATTFTNNPMLLSLTTNLSWVSEKYPLTMTELVVVHAGPLNLILLNEL